MLVIDELGKAKKKKIGKKFQSKWAKEFKGRTRKPGPKTNQAIRNLLKITGGKDTKRNEVESRI